VIPTLSTAGRSRCKWPWLSVNCRSADPIATLSFSPKTLLIGVDGVQYEKILNLDLPNFRRLESKIAYTGGVKGELSEQATDSGPGWATILTGVWAYKHGVTSNNSGMANPNFFSLYKRIQTKKPRPYVASIVHWPTIHTDMFGTDVAGIDFAQIYPEDQTVTDKAVEVLKNTPADFVFLHLDNVDHVGHDHGFGNEYDNALRMFDSQLGQLLDAVEQQSTRGDWLVLVVTDHGRDSRGFNHGSQTRSEKTIFIASNKPLNDEFTEHVPAENEDFDQLYGNAAQTSIAPTVLRHMGIEPQVEWQLDGIPLNGPLGVRKLMPSIHGGATVRWYSMDEGNVSIVRNGKYTTVVPANQGTWNDPEPSDGTIDYTFILNANGTPVSLRKNRNS
jgi:predicted AlkP superfamily pyrophosphatase or phosphodiesterase